MQRNTIVIGFIVVAALVGGCSASSTSAPKVSSVESRATTPAGIVAEVCTQCHPVDRIKAASHDAAAWKVTIDRMRGKGATLSDAQAQQVIDFLAGGGASKL